MLSLENISLILISIPVLFGLAGTSMWRLKHEEYTLAFVSLSMMIFLVRADILRYFTQVYGVYNLPKDSPLFNFANSGLAFGFCQSLILLSVVNLMFHYLRKDKS